MFYPIISLYHEFNTFLSTTGGELFKQSLEFILLLIVTYMIASEWTRDRRRELKYLIIAFATLTIEKLMMMFVLANIVFRDVNPSIFVRYIPVTDNALELFALLLIANAFTYNLYRKRLANLQKKSIFEGIFVLLIFILAEYIWLSELDINNAIEFRQQFMFLLFEIIKIVVLILPVVLMIVYRQFFGKYNRSTILAFIVYSITPIIHIINYLFYGNLSDDLVVLAHPFPFISIVIFTKVIYLKLADKAALKEEMIVTRQKYLQEKEMCRVKDEFIGIVSHELRTPLTAIKLYLGLLLKGELGKLAKKQKEVLEGISKETERLANIISDLLSLSKLTSNKSRLNLANYDLSNLPKELVVQNLKREKNLKILFEIPANFIVKVDVDKFKQVFINLLSNAVKFTPSKGRIIIGAKKGINSWQFWVEDNGPGIQKENIPHLFKRFYQAQDHLTRSQGGLGLGLSIAKEIVDLHKGHIEVESELGKGSKFIITMPY